MRDSRVAASTKNKERRTAAPGGYAGIHHSKFNPPEADYSGGNSPVRYALLIAEGALETPSFS